MKRRDKFGRYQKSERWTQIVGFSIVGGILLGLFIDGQTKPIIYKAEARTEVVEQKVVQIEVKYDWTKERINQLVDEMAVKYGVSASKIKGTIACESGYDTDIKSHHPGEESYGLAQFHLPSRNRTKEGVVITKDMANDPLIAVEAMAWHFSQGNAKAWSCYRQLYM